MGLGSDGVDADEVRTGCVLLPRPGVACGRDGPGDRGGRPRGSRRLRAQQRRLGPRSAAALLRGARGQSSSRPRSSSRRWLRRVSPCVRPFGPAGSSPTSSSATRSASSPRWRRPGRSESKRRSRSCVSVGSRWRRPRARTRARWRRSSDSTTRSWSGSAGASSTCGRRTTTVPGQIVVSGEDPAVEEACAAAEEAGARRAVKLRVSGAFHSPLVARAADRLRPGARKVGFVEPVSPFMSTVTARIESAKRMAPLLVEQLTAPVRFTQAGRP